MNGLKCFSANFYDIWKEFREYVRIENKVVNSTLIPPPNIQHGIKVKLKNIYYI